MWICEDKQSKIFFRAFGKDRIGGLGYFQHGSVLTSCGSMDTIVRVLLANWHSESVSFTSPLPTGWLLERKVCHWWTVFLSSCDYRYAYRTAIYWSRFKEFWFIYFHGFRIVFVLGVWKLLLFYSSLEVRK